MPESKSRVAVVSLLFLSIVCLASFLIPAFIIRPFRYQSPQALSLAMTVKTVAFPIAAVALVGLLLLAIWLWRFSATGLRVGVAVVVLLSAASAVMTRFNYFEWMFNPIRAAGFVSPADAHLADQEMVMAVKIGPEARAYPIRQMAYHQILNDTVAGTPIAVTY